MSLTQSTSATTADAPNTDIPSQRSSKRDELDSVAQNILDLDDARNLSRLVQHIQHPKACNFLITFDDQNARAVIDASNSTLGTILTRRTSATLSTRWLNIFKPHEHQDLLGMLAHQYDFAPRLLAEMCTAPQPHNIAAASLHTQQSKTSSRRFWSARSRMQAATAKPSLDGSVDDISELSSLSGSTTLESKNIYRLASEIWHYTTIDFGRNYICCGYNALYGVSPAIDRDVDGEYHLPSCTRIWSWLIICDDGTIITILEDILPRAKYRCSPLEARVIIETRRNLVNVTQALSLAQNDQTYGNRMTLLPIRARLGSTHEENIHHESDAPGLLFFYLFENWQSSYTLITRKESRYGLELERLRKEMFVQPRLGHIDRLHRVGQELGVLQRHYKSYNCLIDRLLEPRPPTAVSLQSSRVLEAAAETVATQTPLAMLKESTVGVSFSTAARVRFKRLHDEIDLYALSEIDGYLAQKESLISLNFNLLTLRESLDVERLTRITLLLTKATILFLPISFMTSYFSLKLTETEYTITQFWIAFAIILGLSWVALYTFGILSGTAQTAVVFDAIGRGVRRLASKIMPRKAAKTTEQA